MDICNFINRNEGELVGALGGILIAIVASLLTHFFSVYRQRQKEKESYIGLLQTLRVELFYQREQFHLLKEIMSNLKKASIENKTFIVESIPMRLILSICEAILSRIIDYTKYENDILVLLTMYVNQLKDINFYLDFKNAREVLNYVNENRTIEESIAIYFDVFEEEYLKKSQTGNITIHKLIEKELKSFSIQLVDLPVKKKTNQ